MSMSLISELRQQTGQGLMDCKKMIQQAKASLADDASEADILAEAISLLQKISNKKIEKKSTRVASDGVILTGTSANGSYSFVMEVNCETDFVARNDNFKEFTNKLSMLVEKLQPVTMSELLNITYADGLTVDAACKEMISKIGENIKISKFYGMAKAENTLLSYNHGSKLGVLVEFSGNSDAAKDIALHIAANNPIAVDENSICQEVIAKEKQLFELQANDSGKPEAVKEKMVQGRLQKFLAEINLLGQSFVKDEDITVAQYLKQTDTNIISFKRIVLGEV